MVHTTVPTEEGVVSWVHRLFAITPERHSSARERLAAWNIPHLNAELPSSSADGVIGAILLVESVETLIACGVPETKLLAKLRGDPDVWPTWAEIRAAALLARYTSNEAELQIEADRAGGRHADLTLLWEEEHVRHSIEFKAIGLSDHEVEFSRSVAPLLPGYVPRRGILTMHLADTGVSAVSRREERRYRKREAERRAKYLDPVTRQIAAAVIVGHGTEEGYVRRVRNRVLEAVAQLPADDQCWIAIHWSNGAPVEMVRRALASMDLPKHVIGLMLIGSVAIPGRLDNYLMWGLAPFEGELTGPKTAWWSDTGVEDARELFDLVNESCALRPTYVRVPWESKMIDFVLRSGERRIFPYNLVLSPDPPDLAWPRSSN